VVGEFAAEKKIPMISPARTGTETARRRRASSGGSAGKKKKWFPGQAPCRPSRHRVTEMREFAGWGRQPNLVAQSPVLGLDSQSVCSVLLALPSLHVGRGLGAVQSRVRAAGATRFRTPLSRPAPRSNEPRAPVQGWHGNGKIGRTRSSRNSSARSAVGPRCFVYEHRGPRNSRSRYAD